MKLIIAIVNDEDAIDVIELLNEKGYRVTKLATTGGFLKSGNTTLMIGIEADKVDAVLGVIEETCKTRHQVVTNHTSIHHNRCLCAISCGYRSRRSNNFCARCG